MRHNSFFNPISSILSRVAHKLGLETRLLEFHLKRRWHEIAGAQIAAHTRPDQIRFKKLSLLVENSVWLQHLTFLKPTLLEKINESAGGKIVNEIVLRVGEVQQSDVQNVAGESDEGAQPLPTPATMAEAAAHAAAVTDPDLRDRLTAVMANALASRPADRSHRKP
ncbi:MAG TPA: DUF721 domain-containing protein [Nitrospiraceae bacterium]|jgi:hypothetical protein|nr:DUF721 domain-containing protein [Nitrospiraceae bacterium]